MSEEKTPIFEYRDGAEGFFKWCEDKVRIPIYPEGSDIPIWYPMGDLPETVRPDTNRSYKTMWEGQKDELREGLRIKGGRFIYRLLVFCWMRGEGKSVVVCLIQMWKFFCWPRQNIVLGANSKDQVKFVHFDIIRDIILNSPRLLAEIGGKKNVREKEIRMRDKKGNIVSVIRAISSFTGIVSNITGYTFSEMFAMKNYQFFVQLDGSIRNIPNALGCIDSTVSDKKHVLYKMWVDKQKASKGTENLFYSYRQSPEGKQEDFWNPNMTQEQLDGYKIKFPFGEFERYFQNSWGAGRSKVFTEEMIEATHIMEVKGCIGQHNKVIELLKKKNRTLATIERMRDPNRTEGGPIDVFADNSDALDKIASSFNYVSSIYKLEDSNGSPQMASVGDLQKMGDRFDTNWAILVGVDRGDPLKLNRWASRTMVSAIAKGLPGSRSNPFEMYKDGFVATYAYILLHVANVEDHSLEGIKKELVDIYEEFDGIDSVCGERWGLWDLAPWCEDKDIKFEALFPTYAKQRSAFAEVFGSVNQGMFKAPPVRVHGSKEPNILDEEMSIFDHDMEKNWFGSIEKDDKYGIQDDCMYSVGWAFYGGREIGVEVFRERGLIKNLFGVFLQDRELAGRY